MVDKEGASAMELDRIRHELDFTRREVHEVRAANEVLMVDLANADQTAREAAEKAKQSVLAAAELEATKRAPLFEVHAPLPEMALAPSSSAAPPFSPARPAFTPAPLLGLTSNSPRLLLKSQSQPILMPALHNIASP